MSLAEDLFATKKDHENQFKTKEDIIKTMNKNFTEKVKSTKDKIDALELIKEKKIKEEKAKIRKEKKLEKKVKQKIKKLEAKQPIVSYTEDVTTKNSLEDLNDEAIDDDLKVFSPIPTNNKFEFLNNNDGDNILIKSGLDNSSDFVVEDFQRDNFNDSENPSFVSKVLGLRRMVKCEFCDETFNLQDTIGQALHNNEHLQETMDEVDVIETNLTIVESIY